MNIAIIGSGIAGLTCALACIREGMTVKIYEKASALNNIGGGVLLWANGVNYLQQLGLLNKLEPYRQRVKACCFRDPQGHVIFRDNYADLDARVGGGFFPIERSILQQALYQQLPSGTVALNKTCVALQETDQAVTITFSDGSCVQADMVIGADGVHSAVRKCLMDEDVIHREDYDWWGGIIVHADVPDLLPEQSSFSIDYGRVCSIWPLHGDKFMWFMPIKGLNTTLQEWPCNPIIQRLMTVAMRRPHFHTPLHTVTPQQSWPGNRVALIGDAAHAMGPLLALGTSLAIEDSVILLKKLTILSQNIPEAIAQYEQTRYEKLVALHALENKAAGGLINDDIAAIEQYVANLGDVTLLRQFNEVIPWIDRQSCFC